jgi:hypothetical protein
VTAIDGNVRGSEPRTHAYYQTDFDQLTAAVVAAHGAMTTADLEYEWRVSRNTTDVLWHLWAMRLAGEDTSRPRAPERDHVEPDPATVEVMARRLRWLDFEDENGCTPLEWLARFRTPESWAAHRKAADS